MKVAVFLQGTATMHKNGIGLSPKERVKQVIEGEISVPDFESYVPVDNAVLKLNKWASQEAEIIYLSSHEDAEMIKKDQSVLEKYNFPKGPIYWRQNGESYANLVEKIMPDILIEDDCESTGEELEMCYPKIKPELKQKIKHILIKEFQGIDHLPDNLQELANYPVNP